MNDIAAEEIDRVYERLKKEAEAAGYHLNPDTEFTRSLIAGILTNEKRYGYRNCPCRLASGNKEADLDLICPCDYRDSDLLEYGVCYCALYVSGPVLRGEQPVRSIPERHLPPEERMKKKETPVFDSGNLRLPVWRCKVCGYLCARDKPPEICPICKAGQERFERFM